MKKFISLFVSLIAIITVHGQAIKTYSGTYIVRGQYKDNVGTATYNYYNDESGKRVYHGAFVFKTSDSPYPLKSISGHYVHGKRSGKWKIGTYDSGMYYVFEGAFKNDTLNGVYREYIMYCKEGRVYYRDGSWRTISGMPPTPERQFTVCGNKIVGPVISHSHAETKFIQEQKEVTGQTNERGKATGTWVVRNADPDYAHIIQKRLYYEGICYKILTEDNSRGGITVEYHLPKDFVSALKSTYNALSNTFIYQGDTYRLIDYGYTKGVHVNGINEIQNIVDLFEDYPIDPVSLALLKQDYNVTSFNLINTGF